MAIVRTRLSKTTPMTKAEIARLNKLAADIRSGKREIADDPDQLPDDYVPDRIYPNRHLGGRPRRTPEGTQPLTVRIDRDVLTWLRSTGPGYQGRVNELLRRQMRKAKKPAAHRP